MKFSKLIFIFLLFFVSEMFFRTLSFAETATYFPRDEEDALQDTPTPREKQEKDRKEKPKQPLKTKSVTPQNVKNRVSETTPPTPTSSDGNKIYQFNQKNNEVIILDANGRQSIVKLDRAPVALAANRSLGVAYVITAPKGTENHGALYTIGYRDARYQTFGYPVLLGKRPTAIAVSSDGKKAYVTYIDELQDDKTFAVRGGLSVFQVDEKNISLALKSAIGIPQNPVGVAIAPNNRTVYLIQKGKETNSHGTLAALESSSLKTVSQVEIGEDPYSISVSPDGNFVYVAHSGKQQLTVVNVSSVPIQKVMDVSLGNSPIVFGSFYPASSLIE